MKKILISVVLSVISLSNIFAGVPKWITEPYSVYSRDKYIVAVGEGSSKLSAQNKASNGIASFFGQSVESRITGSERIRNSIENNNNTISSKAFLDKDIEVSVDQDDLIGIEYLEFYQDKKHNTWYVLAVMDIEKTCEIYIDKIKENEKVISLLLDYENIEPLAYISRIRKALLIAIENEKMNTRIYLMDPNKKQDITESIKVENELKIQAEKFPIYVQLVNDNGTIKSMFMELLKREAFDVSENISSRFKLEGYVEYLFSKNDDETIAFCEINLQSHLIDIETGYISSSINVKSREGAKSEEVAKTRALKTLQKNIETSFTL